jgi:hypothetical protein
MYVYMLTSFLLKEPLQKILMIRIVFHFLLYLFSYYVILFAMKNALLYMTHIWTSEIQTAFEKLYFMEASDAPETWLLLDSQTPGSAEIAKRYKRCHLFDAEEMMHLPYPHNEGSRLIDHAHFPLLDFYFKHTGFDFYWFIEYDVRFTGKWETLFKAFNSFHHDFITSHIRRYAQEPLWYWWPHFLHLSKTFPDKDLLRSFNVIFRISKRALQFIHGAQIDGWRGLNESTFPTLLHNNGFTILDFGGDGEFVASGFKNRFYTSYSKKNGHLTMGTVRFRPPRDKAGFRKNTIYHPVKPKGILPPEPLLLELLRTVREIARHLQWRLFLKNAR